VTAPAGPDAAAATQARPWWVPLLGVGSVSLGGLQALAGLMMCGVALSAPGEARGAFLLGGLAWLVPGVLLGLSGVAVTAGWPSARRLCFVAVAAAAAGIGAFILGRGSVPAGVADAGEWMLSHPETPEWGLKIVRDAADGDPRRTIALLRDPEVAETAAWAYSGYCCCPVLPWYLLVLAAAFTKGRFSTASTGKTVIRS
jgi:hypothetical protein